MFPAERHVTYAREKKSQPFHNACDNIDSTPDISNPHGIVFLFGPTTM